MTPLPPLGYTEARKVFKLATFPGPVPAADPDDSRRFASAALVMLDLSGNAARFAVARLTTDEFEQGPVNDLAAVSVSADAAATAEAAALLILNLLGTPGLPHGKESETLYLRAQEDARLIGNVAAFCLHLARARAFRRAAALGEPLLLFAAADHFKVSADAAREAHMPTEAALLDYAAAEAEKEARVAHPHT